MTHGTFLVPERKRMTHGTFLVPERKRMTHGTFLVPDWSIIKAECDRQHHFQYSHALDFCFRLFTEEERYSDAVGKCQEFPKGDLVRIDRKLKQEIIKNYLGRFVILRHSFQMFKSML